MFGLDNPFLVSGLLMGGMLLASVPPALRSGEETFTAVVEKKVGYRFLLDLPEGYETGESWPLMVFLHGSGERGDDLQKVAVHGPPKEIRAGRKIPMIVASPQCPANEVWDADAVVALVDHLCATHKVDKSRIYLTGLSMGGFGTWETGIAHPEKFAALVPICGGGGIRYLAVDRIRNTPVWCFHGGKDPVVDVGQSVKMVDRLKGLGGRVEFTVYPEAGHDSWTESYANDGLYRWLLEQQLPAADPR